PSRDFAAMGSRPSTLATELAPLDGAPPIGEMVVAPQNSHPPPSKPSPPVGHGTTGPGQASDAGRPRSRQPHAVDDGGFSDASLPRPPHHNLAITAQRIDQTPKPTLKIGTIEVHLLPAPLAAQTDARTAARSLSSTLSRGFGSLF